VKLFLEGLQSSSENATYVVTLAAVEVGLLRFAMSMTMCDRGWQELRSCGPINLGLLKDASWLQVETEIVTSGKV
jgi:hypothetical protein